jgi:tetratricopeptide (TPR) repeat protein
MSRSKALSGEALSMARQLKSQRALHDALHARIYALSGPDDIDALLRVADELLSLPGERPAWLAGEALFASYRAHLYRCDTAKADACLRDLGREAQLQGLSEALYHHDFFLAQRAFSRGEFAESEQSFEELSARGARLNLWQAPILHSVAKMLLVNEREGMSAVAKAQGLDAMLAGLVTLPPCYAATGARLAAEAGRLELARELLHQLTQHDFQRVVKDLGYVNALTNLALVAIELDDRAQARAIFERLAPYPGHNTPSGAIGFYEGAAARFLAALAAFLGEPESLVCRYYDDALTLNEQLGALPLVARTAYEYARFLFKCERKTVADALQRRALELAERFGMHALAQQTRAL